MKYWVLLHTTFAVYFFLLSQVKAQDNLTLQNVSIGGVLGNALKISKEGRLKNIIEDEKSPLLRIFTIDTAKKSASRGWRGEVAGKWMHTSAMCLQRESDKELETNLLRAADFLIKNQWEDGYIGTFNDTSRFNGAKRKNNQTFDLWMCGYIMQGFLQLYELKQNPAHLSAAKKIADLAVNYFMGGNRKVVNSGPFSGMASAAVLEHFVDLYSITKDQTYYRFCEYIINDLDKRPGSEWIKRFSQQYDAAQIGEGKMYEMIKCLVGLAKFQMYARKDIYGNVLENAWNEIAAFHLNAAGAPMGGLKIHPECFNYRYVFSPYMNTETCAMMDWIRFNKAMLRLDTNAKYANIIEHNAYNALLGAQFPDGFGWQYHSHMNGKRELTSPDACCSSSGAVSLEEVAQEVVKIEGNQVFFNVYSPVNVNLLLSGKKIRISQLANYPYHTNLKFVVNSGSNASFQLIFHVPDWAEQYKLLVNGQVTVTDLRRGYITLNRVWGKNDIVELQLPNKFYTRKAEQAYTPEGYYNDNEQEYIAIYKGPLLYATEVKDIFKEPNPPVLPKTFNVNADIAGDKVKGLSGNYVLKPYYLVNDRKKDTYHAVWFLMK